MPLRPVNESIREINDNSWVIGENLLLSRGKLPADGPTWSNGGGSFYSISEAVYPLPPSRPLSATSNIQKVYDAGGVSAVWIVGNAICKVKILDPSWTREHVTLRYLHDKRPLSFNVPDVHYHAEHDDRYYIIQSRLAGETLILSGHRRRNHKAAICQPNSEGLQPCKPTENSKELGMDCSKFLFYHSDLGPGNIIVNTVDGSLGIIDWETAGFVPKEWIRTKFCISTGIDLPGDDHAARVDWRRRVQRHLGKEGFPEISDRWMIWWSNEI